MKTVHKIIHGDSRQMNLLADKSAQLVVTSPPYWQLKDYGIKNQIGYHENYETYINNLNLVWKECYRILDNGCRLCINIGDQFARAVYYGRYKVIPIRTEIIKFCESIGFDYMGAIIWQKQTTTNTTGGASLMGSFPTPRNGILYEFLKDKINLHIEKEFEKFPYRFIDYQNFDKKIDPKKLQFGSRIDKNSNQREEYYLVKEIISPELVRLSNDLVIRLIGCEREKKCQWRCHKIFER